MMVLIYAVTYNVRLPDRVFVHTNEGIVREVRKKDRETGKKNMLGIKINLSSKEDLP